MKKIIVYIASLLFVTGLTLPLSAVAGPDSFILTVKTNNQGTSDNDQFTIHTTGSGYDYSVDCDSNGIDEATHVTGDYICDYGLQPVGSDWTFHVTIDGIFPRIFFNGGPNGAAHDALKILSVDQWGTQPWRFMNHAFYGCHNLRILATDKPDLSHVENMNSMFAFAYALTGDLSGWDVSHVTDMIQLFTSCYSFNSDISRWDVSNVTNMKFMFAYTYRFNQDIGDWDVSQVSNMSYMFAGNDAFDQDLGDWNVSRVTEMTDMFKGAKLSVSQYDNLLNSWADLDRPPQNITFNGGNSTYCNGDMGRAILVGDNDWSFDDDHEDCSYLVTSPRERQVKSGIRTVGIFETRTSGTGTPTYAITGGADGNLFVLDGVTGMLWFKQAPNAHVPTDANQDNIYRVRVTSTDGVSRDTQTLRIKVIPGFPWTMFTPIFVHAGAGLTEN